MGICRSIQLNDFRNFGSARVVLAPGVNAFVGANGQGKTNLLEAVYFLSVLRSFRTGRLQHLRRWQADAFTLNARVQVGEDHQSRLAVRYGEQRQLRCDGVAVERASAFIGRLVAVPFLPEDIQLIKGTGAARRHFIDVSLCQQQPDYVAVLREFQTALAARNALLKRQPIDLGSVKAYDTVLASRAARVFRYRRGFCGGVAPLVAGMAGRVVPRGDVLRIRYRPSPAALLEAEDGEVEGLCLRALAEGFESDSERQFTRLGPQRDDLELTLNGRSLAHFGSEGQCRLAALVLKAAVAEYLTARRGVVLLVDDVIGELDASRRDAFCDALRGSAQVLVAVTERSRLGALVPDAAFRVDSGTVHA